MDVQFGNYPDVNTSGNITFTQATCKKVLTHVSTKSMPPDITIARMSIY